MLNAWCRSFVVVVVFHYLFSIHIFYKIFRVLRLGFGFSEVEFRSY